MHVSLVTELTGGASFAQTLEARVAGDAPAGGQS
jgi:hypothetical protein